MGPDSNSTFVGPVNPGERPPKADDRDVRWIVTHDGHRYLPMPYDWYDSQGGNFDNVEVEFGEKGELILRPCRIKVA